MYPAGAKVTNGGGFEPDEEAAYYALIHTVLGVQVRQPFGGGFCGAGPLCKLPGHSLNIVCGETMHQRVDYQHDEEKYHDR